MLTNLDTKLKGSQLTIARSASTLTLPELKHLDAKINSKMNKNKFSYLFGNKDIPLANSSKKTTKPNEKSMKSIVFKDSY